MEGSSTATPVAPLIFLMMCRLRAYTRKTERGSGETSGSDVIGTRAGSDGASAGLLNAGDEIVTLRVRCAIPAHGEPMAKKCIGGYIVDFKTTTTKTHLLY